MPVIYRPSETWPDTAGADDATVLGDETAAVGDEADSGAKLLTLLAGPPYNRAQPSATATAAVTRRAVLTARVGGG